MTYLDVANVLENFIEGRDGKWDWDDYLSATTFDDPYVQQVQMRMALLDTEFPAEQKGHYCGPAGIEVIRHYVEELRTKATEGK